MPSALFLGDDLLTPLDDARVVEAVARAEKGTRGEVRLYLERRCPTTDPLDRARDRFAHLHMHSTADATGVLLYVALAPRVACVRAGEGIPGGASSGFWDAVIERVRPSAEEASVADDLVAAIDRIGEILRRVLPDHDDARGNELPDEVGR